MASSSSLHFSLFLVILASLCDQICEASVDDSNLGLFSHTFAEADKKFSDACLTLQLAHPSVTLLTFRHPHVVGPNGEDLSIRVCVFGDEKADVSLVVLSGAHGAELYAGSAIQVSMMQAFDANTPYTIRTNGVKYVFIHALCPWGAAWGFKENAENIDVLKNLNRVYQAAEKFPNQLITEFIDALDIEHLNDDKVQERARKAFETYISTHYAEFMRQLSFGQNKRMDGPSYFGTEACWESKTIEQVFLQQLSNSKSIVLWDLHSAAGEYGKWFFAGYDVQSADTISEWVRKSKSGASVVPLQYAGVGMEPWPFYEFLKEINPHSKLIRFVSEAGTFPQENYQEYLMIGLHCRFHGEMDSAFCQAVHEKVKEYFYPERSDWMQAIHENAVALIKTVQSGIHNLVVERDRDPPHTLTIMGTIVSTYVLLVLLLWFVSSRLLRNFRRGKNV